MSVCVANILQGVAQMQQSGAAVPAGVPKQARALQSLIQATVSAISTSEEG